MKFDELVQQILLRPNMYMRSEDAIEELEIMFHGYSVALAKHQIKDDFVHFNRAFGEYLQNEFGWSTSRGWAAAIRNNGGQSDGFQQFKKLYAGFRAKAA